MLSVAAGAVALGCGGGGGSDTSTDAAASGGPNAVRDIQPAAQTQAESMLLQLSDLPAEWRASPNDPSSDEDRADFLGCLGVDLSDLTLIGQADSDDFEMDNAEVSSSANVFPTDTEAQKAADAYVAGLTGPKAPDCFKDIFDESLKNESEGGVSYKAGDVEIGELNVPPPSGVAQFRAVQLELPVEVEGLSISFLLDSVYMRQADAVDSVTIFDEASSLDTDLRDQLIQVVASRMSSG